MPVLGGWFFLLLCGFKNLSIKRNPFLPEKKFVLAGQDDGLLDATLLWLAQVYSSHILVLFRYRLNGAAGLSSLDS